MYVPTLNPLHQRGTAWGKRYKSKKIIRNLQEKTKKNSIFFYIAVHSSTPLTRFTALLFLSIFTSACLSVVLTYEKAGLTDEHRRLAVHAEKFFNDRREDMRRYTLKLAAQVDCETYAEIL